MSTNHERPTSSSNPFDGFSKKSQEEKRALIAQWAKLTDEELQLLGSGGLDPVKASQLVENVVGIYSLPMGVATNFLIDGKDYVVPMVVEETSIIAAASSAAKWVRHNGGFQTRIRGRLIIGQIQFPYIQDVDRFVRIMERHESDLLKRANQLVPGLVERGGGVQGFQIRVLEGNMVVVHVLCDPCDAMGANLMNQICEGLKPKLEELTGESIGLCILSNLVDTKLVEASCEIRNIDEVMARNIESATEFAARDPYRAATHIKGIMNGIDPVLIATGNDWRAVEAACHQYSHLAGANLALSQWNYVEGRLCGSLVLPLAVGTVGGVTKIHPLAQVSLKMLDVGSSLDLSRVLVAVGLAQNLAALKALCSEGITHGHMKLHASNYALMAGAEGYEVYTLTELLKKERHVTLTRAKEILQQLRSDEDHETYRFQHHTH